MTTVDIIKDLTNELGLSAFYQTLQEQYQQPAYSDLDFDKRLQLLLEAEQIERKNKKHIRLQRNAKLHDKNASVEDITFINRSLDKSVILDLASVKFIEQSHNIIFTGPTGTGKSYLAQALANKAMQKGHSTFYIRVPRLMQYLSSIRGDENYLKYLAKLSKFRVLILDDFGVSQLKAAESRDLLEIIEDRVNLSTIITSQLPIKEWHGYLHNPTVADAILDRIVHSSHKIELQGESLRKTQKSIKN